MFVPFKWFFVTVGLVGKLIGQVNHGVDLFYFTTNSNITSCTFYYFPNLSRRIIL